MGRLSLTYAEYYDRVLGGWIGKSIGGTVGARFEGQKQWIEIDPAEAFPDKVPPNDDLDLQVVWLKVLEERGAALTSDDLADAWLEGCWYPFNEYGNFRRNYKLGLHAPYTGSFDNEFFETGMGCPIRSEIWGYVFPGAPDLAAAYAEKDGTLDHSGQSVGAEKMFAAMASLAFFIHDIRRLIELTKHHLPAGSAIQFLVETALRSHDEGLTLRECRDRLIALHGHPEACDAVLNVPFTILGMLFGKGDLGETCLKSLNCGYDTDCTCATSTAFIGQILGAKAIPPRWKDPIGDELVMGIQYNRKEMTLSALARDTVRVGVLIGKELDAGVDFEDVPRLEPLPAVEKPRVTLEVDYDGDPCCAPGESVRVCIEVKGERASNAVVRVIPPQGWQVFPSGRTLPTGTNQSDFTLSAEPWARELPRRNLFRAVVDEGGVPCGGREFGVVGATLWRFLGVYFDSRADADYVNEGAVPWNGMQHHHAYIGKAYIPEPEPDADALYKSWSRLLGRPALLPCRTVRVQPAQLTGLAGACCFYLLREFVSPVEREAYFAIGNNDSFKIWLNGSLVHSAAQSTWWSPYNHVLNVHLRKGVNRILLKLLRRGDHLDFSLAIREHGPRDFFHGGDWLTDMADVNPEARR